LSLNTIESHTNTEHQEFDEAAFKLFLDKMKEKLPCVFRMNKANPFIKGNFEEMINNSEIMNKSFNLKDSNVEVSKVKLTSNCFNVYNINIPRMELKKNANLKEFHKFIQYSVDSGMISRQEAVSMVPPFILNIKKGDYVLDMCAAPGSKTGQFLETMYENINYFSNEDNGFVIANDNNITRAYMMTHQLQRFNTADLLVVSHDSQNFPSLFNNFSSSDDKCEKVSPTNEKIKFDKILADVPCSSDAVMRKLPHKWRSWSPKDSFHLHKLQLSILKRGIAMLKVGGEIVYSTCSLNPIENEAVIAEVLKTCSNEIEIVDCSHLFSGSDISIKAREGLTNWKLYVENPQNKEELIEIPNKECEMYKKHEGLISETCFNTLPIDKAEELKKCIRILPHDSDTSGFFIVLLRKKKIVEVVEKEEKDIKDFDKNKKVFEIKVKGGCVLENYGITLFDSVKHKEEINCIKNYYGLKEDFPYYQLASHSDKTRKINYISKGVYKYLKNDLRQQVKVITVGVRVFSYMTNNNDCKYRVCQDGLNYILPYMTKRIYSVSEEVYKDLLITGCLRLEDLTKKYNEVDLANNLSKESVGCIVIVLSKKRINPEDFKISEIVKENLVEAMSCYLSKSYTITPQISKEFQHMYSIKFGIKVKPYVFNEFKEKTDTDSKVNNLKDLNEDALDDADDIGGD
jgi:16S rRNA C967 or C1407 C5-methylase (RsmB/RsmF family)